VADVTLWIDPPSYHCERDRLFDVDGAPNSGDSIHAPYAYLRALLTARGVDVHTADLLDRRALQRGRNLYVSTGITKRFRRLARRGDVIMSAFFALEAPIVAPNMFATLHEADRHFRRMFAVNDGGSMRPFLRAPVRFEAVRYPYPFESVDEQAWSRRGRSFLVMINGNKAIPGDGRELYSERLKVIEFFAREHEIDLYGVGWDGPPYRVSGRAWMPGTVRRAARRLEHARDHLRGDPLLLAARKAWRGRVSSKAAVLARYRFSICIENQLLDGWVTEKILDCMRAGCVPAYLGAPDVDRWIPPECFVDMRAFDGYAELGSYLRSLGGRELQGYREAGREFLCSERFKPFTKQAFADVFSRIVAEDAGA
jgi:hypothetical protein